MEVKDITIKIQVARSDGIGLVTQVTRLIGYDGVQFPKHSITLHNEVGPAYIVSYLGGSTVVEAWYVSGLLHRIDGPAVIPYSKIGTPEYHLFGKRISEKDFYTPGFIDAFILENS